MHCDKSNNNNPRLYGYLTKHKENHTESEKTCVYYRKKLIFVQFLYFVKLCHMIHKIVNIYSDILKTVLHACNTVSCKCD